MIQTMNEGKQFYMRLHAILNHRDLYRRMAEINIRARVTELFFDTGLGFTPHQVIRQVVFGDEKLLSFDLSGCGGIYRLRFHPLNAPLAIHLDRIEAIDAQGMCHELAPGHSNALWREGSHWIFQADHPWMIVDIARITNPQKLLIHLRYLAIDAEIYPEILKVKEQERDRMMQAKEEEAEVLQAEIRRKDEMIRGLMNSTSWRLTRPLRWMKKILKS